MMRVTEAEWDAIKAKRQAPVIIEVAAKPKTVDVAPYKTKAGCVIKQSRKKPNKTEQRFENDHLVAGWASGSIVQYGFEAITLKLANGLRYTPDWWVITHDGNTIFYEVKGGFIREDAIAKLKIAATQFKCYEFYLCVWRKGQWTIEEVLA
jgi:hypothetical protein